MLRLRQLLTRRKVLNDDGDEFSEGKQEETNQGSQGEAIESVLATSTHAITSRASSVIQESSATLREGKEKEVRPSKTEIKANLKVIRIDDQEYIHAVTLTSDGKHILAGGTEGKIQCWGLADGKEVGKPMDAGDWVYNIAVSEKWVVSGASGGLVRVFNAESREMVRELKGHPEHVNAVDVSPDGTKVTSGSDDGTVRIWSVSTGKELRRLWHDHSVATAKFSPNGLFIAIVTRYRGSLRIYKTENGQLLADFDIYVGTCRQPLAWHHDSQYLFVSSVDGYIHQLDVVTRKTLSKWYMSHGSDLQCIALSSDNTFIAASAGHFVSLWDTATHEQIGPLVEHASHIASTIISPDNDLVMGGGNTVMLVDLHDILLSDYRNKVRKLHNKLASLRSRYEIQSRNLAAVRKKLQIAALVAELARRKRSVAMTMDQLVAVRRELDQLPDVSQELIVARNDLRTSETQIHHIHQYHNSQLRNFTSVVAKDQPESPEIWHHVNDSGVYAEKTIIRTLKTLNRIVQRTSTYIAMYFLCHVQPPSSEEELCAARRASKYIPKALVDRLRTVSHHALSLYLSIAFQAYLTTHACSIISSWSMNTQTDELLSNAYEQLYKLESQTSASGWRSLIYASVLTSTSTSNSLASRAIEGLSDIVVTAGCAASTSDAVSKMSPKFWHDILSIVSTAEHLRKLTGSALTADFRTIVARPAQMFDDTSMVLDPGFEVGQGTGVGSAKGRRVLCATHLGLMKEVAQESPGPGQPHTLVGSVVVKGAVVLREIR